MSVPLEFKICNRITVRTWRKNKLKISPNITNVIRIRKTKSSLIDFIRDRVFAIRLIHLQQTQTLKICIRKLSTFLLIFTLDKTTATLAKVKAPSDVLEC